MTSNPCAKIVDEPEKARERYLTSHEEMRLAQTMKDDLAFLRLPFEVSLQYRYAEEYRTAEVES